MAGESTNVVLVVEVVDVVEVVVEVEVVVVGGRVVVVLVEVVVVGGIVVVEEVVVVLELVEVELGRVVGVETVVVGLGTVVEVVGLLVVDVVVGTGLGAGLVEVVVEALEVGLVVDVVAVDVVAGSVEGDPETACALAATTLVGGFVVTDACSVSISGLRFSTKPATCRSAATRGEATVPTDSSAGSSEKNQKAPPTTRARTATSLKATELTSAAVIRRRVARNALKCFNRSARPSQSVYGGNTTSGAVATASGIFP